MREGLGCAALAAVVALGGPGAAVGSAGTVDLLPAVVGTSEAYASLGRTGLALAGWDAVSYRLGAVPSPGSDRHEAVWRGLVWRFAGEANRAAFLADPEAFAPHLGGYDAASVADGRVADPDPLVFALVSDDLYLFRTAAGRERFVRDGLRERAEAAWPSLRAGLVEH